MSYKDDVARELKDVLSQWDMLQGNPNATERDFARLKARITSLCDLLDELERHEKPL
jgi:hypothetical protein